MPNNLPTSTAILLTVALYVALIGAATAALCTGNLSSADWLTTVTGATTAAGAIIGAHVGVSAALTTPPTSPAPVATTASPPQPPAAQVPEATPAAPPQLV